MSTTTTSTNVSTVADLYAAFGRGDVPHILEAMTDDVSWEHGTRVTDLPWMQPRTGKQQVGEFFGALGQGLALSTFDPQMILADGDKVVAVIRIAGSIVSTGKPVEEDLWVHLWTIGDDGKVVAFRHIGDLAREEIPFKS
jgi:ketosteroid isomerase-like protein